jgi:MFS family permease
MVLAIIGVNICTSMASLATLTFLPVYLTEDLGYSKVMLGFHIGLLYAMGAVSQPILGRLSDRFGRKTILLPSLVLFGCFYLTLAVAAPGIQLALVVMAMGLFFYALATVTQAAVMDVASDQVQGSTLGVTSLFGQIITLPSPIVAGLVVNNWGQQAAFVYSGVIVLIGALILAVIHVPRSSRRAQIG